MYLKEDYVHLKWRLRESALVPCFSIRIVDSCYQCSRSSISKLRIKMQNVEQCYSCPDPSADRMEATSMLGHRSARDPYFTDTSGRSDAQVGVGFEEHRAIFDYILRSWQMALSLQWLLMSPYFWCPYSAKVSRDIVAKRMGFPCASHVRSTMQRNKNDIPYSLPAYDA